jgi:hypothetical protein
MLSKALSDKMLKKKSHKSLSLIIIATFKLLSINRITTTGTVRGDVKVSEFPTFSTASVLLYLVHF